MQTRKDKTFTHEGAAAETFLKAMRRRFACKRFKSDLPLSAETIRFILDCGRLSPSSFGLEAWFFAVAVEKKLISALGDACFAQEAAYTAPCLIVLLSQREKAFQLDSPFIKQRAGRFPGGYPEFAGDYRGYYEFLEREGRTIHWARAQTYIAAANMMTGAAAIGLDSCPLEGFDEARVLAALGRRAEDWTVGLVLAFGLRDEAPREKIREDLASLTDFAEL